MSKKGIFPGSFDPITVGHIDIITRGLEIFDQIIVAIGCNSEKEYFFSEKDRLHMLELCFKNIPRIEVAPYDGLTVNFAKKSGVKFLLRGLRSPQDIIYERLVKSVNRRIDPDIETIYLLSNNENTEVSSTLVRELIKQKQPVDDLLPNEIIEYVKGLKYSS